MNDLYEKLYTEVLAEKGTELTEIQNQKFKQACFNAIRDNPNLELSGLKISARFQLSLILEFPELKL